GGFEGVQSLVHIYVLTNIPWTATVSYTSTRIYFKEPVMSDIQKAVQEKYGAIAASVKDRASSVSIGCCGPIACGCSDPITSNLYSDTERGALPDTAVQASLGCGNPTALLALEPG